MTKSYHNPESVEIGTSPTGVLWVAYREGETDEAFAAKVETMREALADLWRRAGKVA